MSRIEEFQKRLTSLLEEYNVELTEPMDMELREASIERYSTCSSYFKDINYRRNVSEGIITLRMKIRSVSDWEIEN